MTRWKRLRGMMLAKGIAFVLALALAGTACAGAVGALYLGSYVGSDVSADYTGLWANLTNYQEMVEEYCFLSLYQDALTTQGQELWESLSMELDSTQTNLRFRMRDISTSSQLCGNSTESFWVSDECSESMEEAFTAYELGCNRELSYYLDLTLTEDWVRVQGTVDDWASETQASTYFYSTEEELWTDDEALGLEESTTAVEETSDSNVAIASDSGSEEWYYYYVYQGDRRSYQISMAVDLTFPVEDVFSQSYQSYQQMQALYEEWFQPILLLAGVSLLGFCLLLIWLTWSAGWNQAGELALRGLNRLPVEVVLVGGMLALLFVLRCFAWGIPSGSSLVGYMIFSGITGVFGCLCLLAMWYILTAQLKTRELLKNSLCWRLLRRGRSLCRQLWAGVGSALQSWPLYWKVALACLGYSVLQLFWSVVIVQHLFWNLNLGLGVWIVESIPLVLPTLLLCKWAVDFRHICVGAEKIARGDLDYRIDTAHMLPDLKGHADQLGQISEGLGVAVEERVKSQRFKTELITNVSHDLKTPLTSIINYVDLLKKAEIEDESIRGYIDVLDRKSQRLKTLTEDLVEASKAASGTIAVQFERLDLPQLVEQAVGEYEERLERAGLTPVISTPKEPCLVRADGRHLWRVLDNLLGNCTKYAMPGTRVYLDVTASEQQCTVTVKNISADPLNVPADELMKRFVRGDSARSTEGSGLGLSIARNLTIAQQGAFDLVVDGDLFKAIVTLKRAQPDPEPGDHMQPQQPQAQPMGGEPMPVVRTDPVKSPVAPDKEAPAVPTAPTAPENGEGFPPCDT